MDPPVGVLQLSGGGNVGERNNFENNNIGTG